MHRKLRRAVERHPLLWIAAAAAAAVVVADGNFAAGAPAGLAILVLVALAGVRKIAAAALVAALAAGLFHAGRLGPQQQAAAAIELSGIRSAEATGRLLSPPRISGGGWTALVALSGSDPGGRVSWRGKGEAPLRGETIRARGDFQPLPERRNPGTFDVAAWLHRQGAWGVFEERGERSRLAPAPFLTRLGERLREAFRQAVTSGLDPEGREAAVIRAMVLGDNPEDDAPLVEAYRASGTLHVFSVSGMHVAMIGIIGWFVLKWLGVARRPAIGFIIVGMLAYAWITGMKPPAVRSVTMATIVLGAFFLRRRPDLLNALGLALLLAVLADGHLIFQAGVQLSFGVVFVMGLAASAASRLFSWMAWREPYLPLQLYTKHGEWWLRLRQRTATAFGASTAASVGSIPLTLWHFGFLAPISIVASTMIGVAVLALMSLALFAVVLSPLRPAQELVNKLNGKVAGICTGIAGSFAAIPGGNRTFPRDRPGEDFLIVYDPGYGNGASVLRENGRTLLFDTAGAGSFRHMLGPSLRHLALQPETILLSHPDGGHVGGALEALDTFPVREILIPVKKARSKFFRDLVVAAEERQIPMVAGNAAEGRRISGEAWIEVLHEPDADDQNARADERVMVFRLHWHGWRILFLSDAGWGIERAMLESGRDLGADVIVAGRHGSDSSMGASFLEAVKPRAIIAGHADFPAQERIPVRWAADCERRGIRLVHQGKTGAATLLPGENGSLEIRGFADGSSVSLTR